MTPERYAQLRRMYFAVAECEAGLRPGLLDSIRRSDPSLGDHLERLLAHGEHVTDSLREPLLNDGLRAHLTALLLEDGGLDDRQPETIGAYRIIRKIGDGGMGTVYQAQQDTPRRMVALKVIRPDLMTPAALHRFEHEAHVLGRLRHSGIAQIYEFGIAAIDGKPQPFFAMELIQGRRLGEYIAEHRLDVPRRLELFMRICAAVHYAHQRGVIHRDLKPANILVEEPEPGVGNEADGGRSAQPRILDFGIARVTDSEPGSATVATGSGRPVGTLAYMSPEQASGGREAIDVRSDVYSLGVMLYELLAGRLPYETGGEPLHEAVRIIHERTPVRLGQFGRTFRGDLETIVGRALEKDVQRRYQSASDLASDIQSWLRRGPIMARSPGAIYQLRHFARRNRALVSGAGAALAALSVGMAMTGWQAIRAKREQHAAEISRGEAQREAERADAILRFLLEDTITAANAWGLGRDLKVMDAFVAASAKLDGTFAGHDDVRAAVLRTLGQAFYRLGDYEAAERHLRRASALHASLWGGDDPRTLACLKDLGNALAALGRFGEAEGLHRRAYDGFGRRFGGEDRRTLSAMSDLASALFEQRGEPGKAEDARRLFRACLDGRRRALGPDDPETLHSMTELARYLHTFSEEAEAEGLLRDVLERRTSLLGAGHPETLLSARNLGVHLVDMSRFAEAAPLLQGAYDGLRAALGEDHPRTLGTAQELGRLQRTLGRIDEAEKLFRFALRVQRQRLGVAHGDTLLTMNSLVVMLIAQEKLEEAERMALELLALRAEHSGAEHDQTLAVRHNLATVYAKQERWGEAEAQYRAAYDGYRRRYGEAGDNTVKIAADLGWTLQKLGRDDEAAQLLGDALSRVRGAHGAAHPLCRTVLLKYGPLLVKRGQYDAAEPLYREVVDADRPGEGQYRPVWAALLCDHGACLAKMGRFEEAEERLLRGHKEMQAFGERQRARAVMLIDELYAAWGRPELSAAFHRGLEAGASVAADTPPASGP